MLNYFNSPEFAAGMLPVIIVSVSLFLLFCTRRWEREGRHMKFLYRREKSIHETKNGHVFYLRKCAGTFRAYLITDEDCPGAVSDENGRYLETFCAKSDAAKRYLDSLDG